MKETNIEVHTKHGHRVNVAFEKSKALKTRLFMASIFSADLAKELLQELPSHKNIEKIGSTSLYSRKDMPLRNKFDELIHEHDLDLVFGDLFSLNLPKKSIDLSILENTGANPLMLKRVEYLHTILQTDGVLIIMDRIDTIKPIHDEIQCCYEKLACVDTVSMRRTFFRKRKNLIAKKNLHLLKDQETPTTIDISIPSRPVESCLRLEAKQAFTGAFEIIVEKQPSRYFNDVINNGKTQDQPLQKLNGWNILNAISAGRAKGGITDINKRTVLIKGRVVQVETSIRETAKFEEVSVTPKTEIIGIVIKGSNLGEVFYVE